MSWGGSSEMSLRCPFKMSIQRFCWTLFRFARKLSFTYLESISERCLAAFAKQLLVWHIAHLGMLKFKEVIHQFGPIFPFSRNQSDGFNWTKMYEGLMWRNFISSNVAGLQIFFFQWEHCKTSLYVKGKVVLNMLYALMSSTALIFFDLQ